MTDLFGIERQDDKPLFVPLSAKWFEEFAAGRKDTEYRVYGPRWSEKHCRIGRRVTLSYGYGKARRLHGTIAAFSVVGPEADPAIVEVFPGKDRISAIQIKLDAQP